jgi:hypothetical protein
MHNKQTQHDYNTGKSKNQTLVAHFTQLVWRETTEMGLATATNSDGFFIVARYRPRGNVGVLEDYRRNVPRPRVYQGL